jgi:ketosteroid isomerase-like protein
MVRRAFAQYEQGNFGSPEAFDPNARVVWLDEIAAGERESVGLDSIAQAIGEWLRSWERITMTAERVIDAGDQVVVIAVWRGRGKVSGIDTELRHGQVWTMRDGKVMSLVSYPDPDDALEAVGLPE